MKWPLSRRSLAFAGTATIGVALVTLGKILPSRLEVGRAATDPETVEVATASESLRFVPANHTFGDKPLFSGERIRFDAAIQNSSASSLILKAIPKSCGCMTFGDKGEPNLPITLGPGERFPFHVEIATDGKAGIQRMQLTAQGTTLDGAPIASGTLEVKGRVWTSILALPEAIYAEVGEDEAGSPLVRSIVLADEWPGHELQSPLVTSTAGERLISSLKPAEGNVMVQGLDLRKRHELTISYAISPGTRAFDETITITPKASGARPSTVRLHGRVVPDSELLPDHVVLYSQEPGATLSRVLEYRSRRPNPADLHLIEAPPGITVEPVVSSVGGSRLMRLKVRMPSVAGVEEGAVVFRVGDGPATIRLPLKRVVPAE